jgi:hypothetical protein
VLHALWDDGVDCQFALVEHGGGSPLGGGRDGAVWQGIAAMDRSVFAIRLISFLDLDGDGGDAGRCEIEG